MDERMDVEALAFLKNDSLRNKKSKVGANLV
jgi:hypothetical protein